MRYPAHSWGSDKDLPKQTETEQKQDLPKQKQKNMALSCPFVGE
jgi:hypothetical protein